MGMEKMYRPYGGPRSITLYDVCTPSSVLTYAFVRVIVSSIRTNRARCALYKKLLDLVDEESFSGALSGRASL